MAKGILRFDLPRLLARGAGLRIHSAHSCHAGRRQLLHRSNATDHVPVRFSYPSGAPETAEPTSVMSVVRNSGHGDASVLEMGGPLLGRAGAELRDRIDDLLRRGTRMIVLDLTGVADIDAAGLGELVMAYNSAIAAKAVLRVAHVDGTTRELLARVGLLDLLTDTDDSA